MSDTIRVGLIGAGGNTKKRHIPGLLAESGVEIVAVCNRRPESTAAVATEFAIPRTFERWQDLVADPGIDAVVVGTWPYLHREIALAALAAGKHFLTEARMAMNAAEAHAMLTASRQFPKLVAQIVPSPYGLTFDSFVKQLLRDGFLGELREAEVVGRNGTLADPTAPLSWRQDASLSGYNMLALGILHEALMRWAPQPLRVSAEVRAFIPMRIDPAGIGRAVGTPDSVQVIAALGNGVRATYQLSGVTPFGGGKWIKLFGSDGYLHCDILADRLFGQTKGDAAVREFDVPSSQRSGWRVEADFIDSIRTGAPVRFTPFDVGVQYMEFTEAVAKSAERGVAVTLPLTVAGG